MSWFIRFWLWSTAISVAAYWITCAAIKAMIGRKYLFKKGATSTIETISAMLKFAIPFINIIITCGCILFRDEIANRAIEKLLDRGCIIPREEDDHA